MSTVLLEMELIELELEDEDSDAHFSCQFCYPDYVPGRKILAFCGVIVTDSANIAISNEPCACPLCNLINECPQCGHMFMSIEF